MGRLSAAPSRLGVARASSASPLCRGSARDRGYTVAWEKASHAFLAEHLLCRGCQALGRVKSSTPTDHVIPHRGIMIRFWDQDWWQASCTWHHDAVKHVFFLIHRRHWHHANMNGLRAHNLACWCGSDQPCHADTLLE